MDAPTDPSRRYCWECQRRRLECDSTRPVCNKCRQAGVVCPGYEDKKPLKWLAPGRVTSRNRKRKTTTAATAKKTEKSAVALQARVTAVLERAVRVATELYNGSTIPVIHLRDDVSETVQSACYCKSNLILSVPLPLLRLTPRPLFRQYAYFSDNATTGALWPLSLHQSFAVGANGLDLRAHTTYLYLSSSWPLSTFDPATQIREGRALVSFSHREGAESPRYFRGGWFLQRS